MQQHQQPPCPHLEAVLERIPSGVYVMASSHDGTRSGVLVEWLQRCSLEPPMVMVALRKGHPIEPIIRDSKVFSLCSLPPGDGYVRRRFENVPDHGEDPFLSFPTFAAPGGCPVLSRATSWFECELMRHLDIECDYELYIGLVRAGAVLPVEAPARGELRTNGCAVCGSPPPPPNGRGKGRPPETKDDRGTPLKNRRRRSA